MFKNGTKLFEQMLIICLWILKLSPLILYIFSDKNQTQTPILIAVDNHRKFYDLLLSISDIC